MIQIAKLRDSDRVVRVKAAIDLEFPAGRFVAVQGERVVADAESHARLVDVLQSKSLSPKDLMILQAGVEYPKTAIIF